MRSVLLIDDKQNLLDGLASGLSEVLGGEVDIRKWHPVGTEDDPRKAFDEKVDSETVLVVTDYDLTAAGQMGLFGSSIVGWCQQLTIPVGDFSRGNTRNLPKEPDLFELRIPTDERAANFIAAIFRGFCDINEAIGVAGASDLLNKRSPAAVLAQVLEVPDLENQFALYSVRLGPTSGALMARLAESAAASAELDDTEKRKLLSYIVGHLLLNAVLRFPGPILSLNALKGYLATDEADREEIRSLLEPGRYNGPFATIDTFYWTYKVDEILDPLLPVDSQTETSGELYRVAIERKLGIQLRKHSCSHCNGVNGGFYCPFTKKTVCPLSHCSVGSSSWIPQGAKLCRVERDFFDEWSPILGL